MPISFVIIRAVLKQLLLLAMSLVLRSERLDEATQNLAQRVAVHLSASETPHIAMRNISSLPSGDLAKLPSTFEHLLPKYPRNGVRADITLTVSENIRGYLLVAEIRSKGQEAVEMVSFKPDAAPSHPQLLAISKRLVLEQQDRILDLIILDDEMLVLEPESLVRYQRNEGRWNKLESAPITPLPLRDPRGRIELEHEQVTVFLPGATCRGTRRPLHLTCELVGANFSLGGVQARFVPGRNTMEGESHPGLDALGDAVPACGDKYFVSGGGPRDAPDVITLFDGTAAISEAAEFPGPVTALWPSAEGAMAVTFNLTTHNYAAYALSVDCGQ